MATRVLLIDNYDSFTYNLVQRFGELGAEPEVFRNDEITVEGIGERRPDRLVISPGPGTPAEAGVSGPAIRRFLGEIPILGVCLGHQALAAVLGGEVVRAPRLMHGKTSEIHHDGLGVYRGLPNPFPATRYHSLIVREASLPAELVKTAWTAEDEVMGIRHRNGLAEGVQFHPESFLTEAGSALLRNFLEARRTLPAEAAWSA